MINLRYHVFSLMAVFAALAIGIVVGSTTVKSGLVDSLRSNVDRAEERIAEVEQENAELRDRDAQLDMLGNEGAQLLTGELVDTRLLWLLAPDVDESVLTGLEDSFAASGATSIGRVVLDDSLFDDAQATQIATALGSSSDDIEQLRADFGAELADRLDTAMAFIETPAPVVVEPDTTDPATSDPAATEPVTTEPVTSGPVTSEPVTTEPVTTEPQTTRPPRTTTTTVPVTTTTLPPVPTGPRVDAMMRAQLGDVEDLGLIDLADLQTEPIAAGEVIRLVIVEDRGGDVDAGSVLLTFVDNLGSQDERRLAVVSEAGLTDAEITDDTPASLVQSIRESGRLRDEVSTVDNAEDFPGWAATVLAVRNGIAGELGHFGYRDGSESLLPAPLT